MSVGSIKIKNACDKSNDSYQAKLFDVMLFVMQYQMVLSFVSVDKIPQKRKVPIVNRCLPLSKS